MHTVQGTGQPLNPRSVQLPAGGEFRIRMCLDDKVGLTEIVIATTAEAEPVNVVHVSSFVRNW